MKCCHSELFIIILVCLLSSCGDGGSSGPVVTSKTLSWDIPTQFTDGSTFDPRTTLKEYEIYVRQDTNFSPADNYVIVSAVDPSNQQLINSFDLSLAYTGLSLSRGVTYYTAMRAVTTDAGCSDFSTPSPVFSF